MMGGGLVLGSLVPRALRAGNGARCCMRRLWIYPLRESFAEAKPRLNFPKEDKPYNLQIDVV